MKKYMLNPFYDIISDEEFDLIPIKIGALNHPLYYLFGNYEIVTSDNHLNNLINQTRNSINTIRNYDFSFLKSIKKRLINSNDFSQPSSALGEIRCYGNLIKVFNNVRVNDKGSSKVPKADFYFKYKDLDCYIEVNTPQINSEKKLYNGELERLEEHNRTIEMNHKNGINISELSIAPYGRYKCENLRENVISKLTKVKEEEHQIKEKNVNILWIDLNDGKMSIIEDTGMINNAIGYVYCCGEKCIFPNLLWYATYGKKGIYIFDGEWYIDKYKKICQMKHNGRFFVGSKSKFTFIIYNFSDKLVIMRNPNKIIRFDLMKRLSELDNYNESISKNCISKSCIKRIIKREYRRIYRFYDEFKNSEK